MCVLEYLFNLVQKYYASYLFILLCMQVSRGEEIQLRQV
jgi:hypothetical protein